MPDGIDEGNADVKQKCKHKHCHCHGSEKKFCCDSCQHASDGDERCNCGHDECRHFQKAPEKDSRGHNQ